MRTESHAVRLEIDKTDHVPHVRGKHVKYTNEQKDINNRVPCGSPVRGGVETDQYVRQSGRAEHKGQQQGQSVFKVGQPVSGLNIGRTGKHLCTVWFASLEGLQGLDY